jgi:opacity protein-like surface antigen
MRKFLWIFAVLLTSSGVAEAQTAGLDRWDVNLSAGLFQNKPFEHTNSWDDEWYGEGRYAASIGYYWTEHFKTELEFAHTTEGSRWHQEFVRVPGTSISHPITTEVFHRLQQGSARAVWQFNENSWVHPYVNGGFVVDRERRTWRATEQFYYPTTPRTQPPVLLRPGIGGADVMEYRYGVTVGGGSKFYVSPNAYVNTGMQVTYAKPATTISFLAGFGVNF